MYTNGRIKILARDGKNVIVDVVQVVVVVGVRRVSWLYILKKRKTFRSGDGTLKCLRLRLVPPSPHPRSTISAVYPPRLNANSSGKRCFDSLVNGGGE